MEFVETPIFTKRIQNLVSNDDYLRLQLLLIKYSESGTIIRGSGGIRKVRWSGIQSGKRGGIRVLYYYLANNQQVYMLFAHSKSEGEKLNDKQLKILRNLVQEELK